MLLLRHIFSHGLENCRACILRFLGLLLIAVSLTACFKPMLAEQTGTSAVPTALGKIFIEINGNRIDQRLRNRLMFLFSSPDHIDAADYKLTYSVTTSISSGLVQLNTEALAQTVTLNVRFTLIETSSGEPVHSGSTFARGTFEKTSALFANERAELDAENRATDSVAESIRVQVASYFAAR
jgi:LPS-assembly lipoprotein